MRRCNRGYATYRHPRPRRAAIGRGSRRLPVAAPDLSYDGVTYTSIAEQILASRTLPQLEFRPPLYPLILALLMRLDGETALAHVVLLQRAAWGACGVLIFLALTRLRLRVV